MERKSLKHLFTPIAYPVSIIVLVIDLANTISDRELLMFLSVASIFLLMLLFYILDIYVIGGDDE